MTSAAPDYDAAALEAHLSRVLDADVVDTELLHEALNLSIRVSTATDPDAHVVRKPNRLRDTDLVNDLREEHAVMERLADTDIPAPEPVHYCEDESVLGSPFYVMTFLDGESLPVGDELPAAFRNPTDRERVGFDLVESLAEIHGVDPGPFEDVCEHQTPREQVEADVERLERATAVTGRDLPTLRSLGEWLLDNAPAETERSLLHGDYKPGNVFFGGQPASLTGVADWETTYLGDPRMELGYLLLYWRDAGDDPPGLSALDGDYETPAAQETIREMAAHGLCPFTTEPGSPTRPELVERYEAASGIDFENERFYRAHAAFALATVWEDINRHQHEAGAEPGEWPIVDYMGVLGRRIADGEFGR